MGKAQASPLAIVIAVVVLIVVLAIVYRLTLGKPTPAVDDDLVVPQPGEYQHGMPGAHAPGAAPVLGRSP